MPGPPLDERFINPTLDARLSWRCEPAHWRMEAGRLRREPDADLREIWLRLERTGADYLVESSTDGASRSQLRLAHLHADDGRGPVAAGLYACSPKAAGYVAEFAYLRLT